MARISRFFIISVGAISLAACGGGGSGGGAPAQTATATISSQNAPAIAAAVTSAADETQFVSDLGGLASPTGASTGAVTVGGAPIEEVTIGPDVEACFVAGSTTFSAEVADPGNLSAGDSISLSFALCDEGDGIVLDGAFNMVVTSFSGDVFADTFVLDVGTTLSNLEFTEGGDSTTVNGDMNLLLETSVTQATTITVDGQSLSVMSMNETATLTNYAMTISADPVTTVTSFSFNGFLSAPEFTGTVQFSTSTPLQLDSLDNPTAGGFVITGADGATITVNIISAQQVELDLDLDGDGSVDEVVMTTWAELQA